jgi:hypothetical protein
MSKQEKPTLVQVMREFVADVDAAGPGKVKEEWPDIAATYTKARGVLSGAKDWEARARVYRDELTRLANTYSLLAASVGGKGKNAKLSEAFAETAREASEAVNKGDAL